MSNTTYDMAIIGSGLGGLVCNYILAKHGFKTILLEKQPQVGGCLQTFRRFGVKYETGMHYIGSMEEGQILHRLFTYLDLIHKVKISKLDETGFDIFSIGGKIYKYASGVEQFVETLGASFPQNKVDIANYIQQIHTIAQRSTLYHFNQIGKTDNYDNPAMKIGVSQWLETITQNLELQNVLAANLPLYAGEKEKTPLYIHAMINHFYNQSAYRIIGGSDMIATALADQIRSFGGEIRLNAEVNKIIGNDTRATAVQLVSGEKIEAKSFISDIHPQTVLPMLDSPLIKKVYRQRIMQIENTVGSFTVYLKFKPNEVPYINANYYYYQNADVWKSNLDKPDSYLYMHQCIQAHQKWAESAELIGRMNYDEVRKWNGTTRGERGTDYLEFKQAKVEAYLDLLERSFPQIRAKIENYETATPLSYRDYTGTYEGSTYGILRDKNAPMSSLISHRTKIPNFMMTGQNMNMHGMLGVIVSALITCSEFLGVETLAKEMNNTL